jgi:hypothetical protein
VTTPRCSRTLHAEHLRAAPRAGAHSHSLPNQDAEPSGQKKMGATPILLKPTSRLGGEPNCTPSDFAILAIFRDKRNQCALYKGSCRAFRDAWRVRRA